MWGWHGATTEGVHGVTTEGVHGVRLRFIWGDDMGRVGGEYGAVQEFAWESYGDNMG